MIKLSLEKQVSSITDSQLQLPLSFLPDVLLKSKVDNMVKSYISGFNLWRASVENTEGIEVTTTKFFYLFLFFVGHIQSNLSFNIILKIFHTVRWVHGVSSLKNPCKNSLVVNICEADKRILSKHIVKQQPITPYHLQLLVKEFGGHCASAPNMRIVTISLLRFHGFF